MLLCFKASVSRKSKENRVTEYKNCMKAETNFLKIRIPVENKVQGNS